MTAVIRNIKTEHIIYMPKALRYDATEEHKRQMDGKVDHIGKQGSSIIKVYT